MSILTLWGARATGVLFEACNMSGIRRPTEGRRGRVGAERVYVSFRDPRQTQTPNHMENENYFEKGQESSKHDVN